MDILAKLSKFYSYNKFKVYKMKIIVEKIKDCQFFGIYLTN